MEQLTAIGQQLGTWLMVVSPVIPYGLQWNEMRKDRSSAGFSALICLVLLTANILRIAFWFGRRFDDSLFYQSVLMIVCQLFMLRAWHTLRPEETFFRASDAYFRDFWQWSSFMTFVWTILGFTGAVAVLTIVLGGQMWYVETIGFLALATESCLGVPQAISNYKRGSTVGLSLGMIGGWFLGDASKTVFFLAVGAPYQFLMCGIIQLTVDIIILAQMVAYK